MEHETDAKLLPRHMKKNIILTFILVLSWIVCANVVFAQENKGSGVTVSPPTFELTANPGDLVANKIKIFNPTNKAVSIKMEAEDFKAVGEEGRVITTSEEDQDTTYSLRKWIKIIPREFTLEPEGQKLVDFIVEVPRGAEPGGKYGSILAGITGSLQETTTGAAISTKTGVLVLLMVAGNTKEEIDIKDFSAPFFQEYGPLPFEIRFENKGTIHARPKGYVAVTDWLGKKAAEIEFDQKNVMPGAVRKIDAKWDAKWLFGKYTASVIGVYGTSNTNLYSQVITFWVLPWKLMLGVLIVIVLLLLILYKSKRRLRLAAKILLKGETK